MIARSTDKAWEGTNSAALYALGSALLLQRNEPSGNQAFAKYVALAGDDGDAVKEAKVNVDVVRFDVLLRKKDAAGAHRFAAEVSERIDGDGRYQNRFARQLLTDPRVSEQRDLSVIERIARRAVEVSAGRNAHTLMTLARVQFMQGSKDEAIKTQETAVQLLKDSPQQQKNAEKALAAYRAGQLPAEE